MIHVTKWDSANVPTGYYELVELTARTVVAHMAKFVPT